MQLFVSHASEDKADFARPLAEALRAVGFKVWFDEFELTLGDSLLEKINEGLAMSDYGGDRDEGEFTPKELAETFHSHLEHVFSNQVCDERANRKNMAGVLETNLLISNVDGQVSRAVPGYVCIGTLYMKRTAKDHVVKFAFKRHPLLKEIYGH